MKKLTKTQQEVLNRVIVVGAQTYTSKFGTGRNGGVVNLGVRDYDAAMLLCRKQLVIKLAHNVETMIEHGHSITYRTVTIGRKEE